MKLQFDPNQPFQIDAVAAVTDLFDGQPRGAPEYAVIQLREGLPLFAGHDRTELGVGNHLLLAEDKLAANTRAVQTRNDIEVADPDAPLEAWDLFDAPANQSRRCPHFSVEMETGTGKTYVYLRTIFEMSRRYGFQKFIIVVPSVAIREGVLKNIEITAEHFRALYNNLPCEHFVYDAKKVNRLRQFATSNTLQILVINIDAFRKNFTGTEAEQKSNVIYKESDKLSGRQPIEFVQAARPIVIIDEPQSVDSTDRARPMTPSCAWSRSTTRRASRPSCASTCRRRTGRRRSRSRSSRARICLRSPMSGPATRTASRWPRSTPSRAASSSVSAMGVPCGWAKRWAACARTCGAPRSSTPSGGTWRRSCRCASAGSRCSRSSSSTAWPTTATTTGRASRRRGSSPRPSRRSWRRWPRTTVTGNWRGSRSRWRSCTTATSPRTRRAVLKDTRGDTQADDEVYNLIMKEKERLLSLDEPLRFIFSHSALREGWDNPNVFQICTLNETKSAVKKRQEIGRGLRLPVDQHGLRVFDESVNKLYVMANESYEDFARTLQKEYENDCGVTFGKVPVTAIAKLMRVVDGEEQPIGRTAAEAIRDALVAQKMLDTEGRIQPAFDPRRRDFKLYLPEEHRDLTPAVIDLLSSYQIERHIRRERDDGLNRLKKEVTLSPEFVALWERIKPKTTYRVEFETDTLVRRTVDAVKRMERIEQPRIRVSAGQLGVEKGGITTAAMSVAEERVEYGSRPVPDVLAYLQNETGLTRSTLVRILKESGRLAEFFDNPQRFMDAVASILKHELHRLLVDGIKYERIGGAGAEAEWEMLLFKNEELINYLTALQVGALPGARDQEHPRLPEAAHQRGRQGPVRTEALRGAGVPFAVAVTADEV